MSKRTKRNIGILIIYIVVGIILTITSNLDTIQVVIFLIAGGIVFVSSKSKTYIIKYIGGGLGLFICGFLSILAYFPLFENTPNIDEFINTQARKIQVTSNNNTSTVIIKQGGFTKKQEIINTKKEIIIKESPISTITFINEQGKNEANMTIQFGDQTTVYIYPNTSFLLLVSGSQQSIEKLNGKIEYMSGIGNKTIIKNADIKKISDFAAKGLWFGYEENLRNFIIKLAGGNIMENEVIRKIAHNSIILGGKIWPKKYLPYLENEKKYIEILGREKTTPKTYEDLKPETTKNIIENAKIGGSKTRFLNIFNTDE